MLYVDIDGILNDYPVSYISFLSERTGKSYNSLQMAKMNIFYSDYILLRNKYRESVEPLLDINYDIVNVINNISSNKLIITKRPIFEKVHFNNTVSFLRRSKINYCNLIYWNKDVKGLNIPHELFNCKYAVEDNFKIALFLESFFKIRVFVLLNEINSEFLNDAKGTNIEFGDIQALKVFLHTTLM